MLFFLITIFASLLLPSIFLIFARTLYLKPNARLFVNLMAMTFMISSVYFIYV